MLVFWFGFGFWDIVPLSGLRCVAFLLPQLLQCWDYKHEPPYPGYTIFFTDEIVALKRLKMEKEKEGFPITSLREINTILKAQHPNIVTVRVRLSLHIWHALPVWEVYPLKGQGRRFRHCRIRC